MDPWGQELNISLGGNTTQPTTGPLYASYLPRVCTRVGERIFNS